MVALIKPQFEVPKWQENFFGVVDDPNLMRTTLENVHESLERENVGIMDATVSPIKGHKGNTEFLALLKTGKGARLNDLITKAIAEGGREASAAALIMRGDMLMERKETLNALKDGYLRVVILYENVKSVQPEALYKAAKAFDALNQNANAERMRTTLRTKYSQSEYARKL